MLYRVYNKIPNRIYVGRREVDEWKTDKYNNFCLLSEKSKKNKWEEALADFIIKECITNKEIDLQQDKGVCQFTSWDNRSDVIKKILKYKGNGRG